MCLYIQLLMGAYLIVINTKIKNDKCQSNFLNLTQMFKQNGAKLKI